MKILKFFGLLVFAALVTITACKNKDAATDAARESLATTNTAANTPPPVDQTANQPNIPSGPLTSIEFEESTFDFGEIMEGEKVLHMFKFKNTGDEPLIISNAKGSCGCTVPDWPREPIPVGGTGEIKVQYDSKGKGQVGGRNESKRVTITANTDPANTFLNLKGKVIKEETPS